MFKNVINYLDRAVQSNTGVSSLSLIVVSAGIMSVVILIVISVCMLVEVLATKTVTASLDGYAAIIGAVAGLITSVVLPKAINNYGENKYRIKETEDITPFFNTKAGILINESFKYYFHYHYYCSHKIQVQFVPMVLFL